MSLLVIEDHGAPDSLEKALQTLGIDAVALLPDALAEGADEVEQIGSALLAVERVLTREEPEAVLVASTSNLALAAVLVATKLQIPVLSRQRVVPDEGRRADLNPRLIEQLADETLAGDAETIAARLRSTYTFGG